MCIYREVCLQHSHTRDEHVYLLPCTPAELVVSFIQCLDKSKGSSYFTAMRDLYSNQKQVCIHKHASSRQVMPMHSMRHSMALVLQRCWDGRKPWGCCWRRYTSCPPPLTGALQRHACTVSSELCLTSPLFLHKWAGICIWCLPSTTVGFLCTTVGFLCTIVGKAHCIRVSASRDKSW